jgi:hypothetical protein
VHPRAFGAAPVGSQPIATTGPLTSPAGAKISGAISPAPNIVPPTVSVDPPGSPNAGVVKASSLTFQPAVRSVASTSSVASA